MLALALLLGATAAWAQSVDLRADSVTVSNNEQSEPFFVTVYFTNQGPTAYGGNTRITVDIDDPTKPGWPGQLPQIACCCQDSVSEEVDLPGTLGVGSSTSVTLQHEFSCNMIAYRATATVEVTSPGFSDPNAGNNTVERIFTQVPIVPAVNRTFLAVLAVLLAGAAWLVRRRFAAARA
jgi:hypothetical protein